VDLEDFWIESLESNFIGDDGAIVGKSIYAMDAFWEGSHFQREWMSPEQIAYKAFMVNLSDMVAMNAKPLYMLLTVALPKDISKEALQKMSSTFNRLSKEHNIALIGGDTIGSDKIGIAITIIGTSEQPLKRDSLQDGDILAYTGTLGEAKRDLERLLRGQSIKSDSKFYKPILRQEFISKASSYLSGGMDISDGLYCDTNKLLKASSLFLKELAVIPPAVGESGEEYEMLVAFPAKNLAKVSKIAKECNTPLTVFAQASTKESKFYPCSSQHFNP